MDMARQFLVELHGIICGHWLLYVCRVGRLPHPASDQHDAAPGVVGAVRHVPPQEPRLRPGRGRAP